MCVVVVLNWIICILGVILCWLQNCRLCCWREKNIPCIKPIPFFGNMLTIVLQRHSWTEFMQHCYNKIPADVKYFGFYEFNSPMLILKDPLLIRNLMVTNSHHFSEHKDHLDQDREPLLWHSFYRLQGDKWKEMRETTQQVFTPANLRLHFDRVQSSSIAFANYLETIDTTDLEITNALSNYTINVITKIVFGCNVETLHNSYKRSRNTIEETWSHLTARSSTWLPIPKMHFIRVYPNLTRMLRICMTRKTYYHFFRSLILEIIGTREERNELPIGDLIDILRTAQDNETGAYELNIDDITSQVFSFYGLNRMITLSMSYMVYAIAKHQNVQEKLRKEVDRVMCENGRTIDYNVLRGMSYLDLVISESMRMYGPMPIIERICTKPCVLPAACEDAKPFTVPFGMSIWIPLTAIHMDGRYFKDPEIFDPERFSPERSNEFPSEAYFPWGQGPKCCLAKEFVMMEMKLVIVRLVYNFRVSLTREMETRGKIEFESDNMFSEPKNGIRLILKRV